MRFEIVDDLGHRFVQIDREQTQVTFSRGLVASQPAVETHDYGTVEAAVAAEQEVAARLNGLGYEDISHDEDTLVIPMEWRRSFEQRRGGLRGVVVAVDPDAPEKLAEILAESEQAAGELIYESADPELASDDPCLVAATRTVLALHAFGAANAGRGSSATAYRKYLLGPFVDTWIAQQGLAFAATVVAEMAGLGVEWIPCRDEHEWHYRLRRERAPKEWLSGGQVFNRWSPHWGSIAIRVRRFLAAAPEDEYSAAVRALAPYRDGVLPQRLICTYLAATKDEWIAADLEPGIARQLPTGLLTGVVRSTEELERLEDEIDMSRLMAGWFWSPTTLLDGVGVELAPHLARWYDRYHHRYYARALTIIPTDEAFDLLLDRADDREVLPLVIDAIDRYPIRAMRRLASRLGRTSVAGRMTSDLFRVHALTKPQLRSKVPAEVRSLIDATVAAKNVRTAPVATLPRLLTAPPWTTRRKPVAPVVVTGLRQPGDTVMRWKPGERDGWDAWRPPDWWERPARNYDEIARIFRAGELEDHRAREFFVQAPMELTAGLFAAWHPADHWAHGVLRPLIARYGLDALPHALRAAKQVPQVYAECLLPYVSVEVATLMAGWSLRSKSTRIPARRWLNRHADQAAAALIPVALAEPGPDRQAAEAALPLFGSKIVLRAAADLPDAARAGARAILDADPFDAWPKRVPSLPDWLDLRVLPAVLVRDEARKLPDDAIQNLITMLMMSKPGEPYPGVAPVSEACEPRSLAEFAWATFQRWQVAGSPPEHDWTISALGWLGDDETVRALAPLIRNWPGVNAAARAAKGVDALAEIGTDVAVMQIHSIAQRIRFKSLRTKAAARIDEIAAERGLTVGQLADRCIPDLGLDADGTLTLDFGPRRFTVDLDETLTPFARDESGRLLKQLPKPGKSDDPERAPAAYRTFGALKREARTVATEQITRLDLAMVDQPAWTRSEFWDLLVAHPLIGHLVRRLVCLGDGVAFRVTGSGAVDAAGADVELDEDALIRIAHPLALADLDQWIGVFASMEIAQPFPQLVREVFTPRAADEWAGQNVESAALFGLERRGWMRGKAGDAATLNYFIRPVPGGDRALAIMFEPGFAIYDPTLDSAEQTLGNVHTGTKDRWPSADVDFATIDPILASEIARDLLAITSDWPLRS